MQHRWTDIGGSLSRQRLARCPSATAHHIMPSCRHIISSTLLPHPLPPLPPPWLLPLHPSHLLRVADTCAGQPARIMVRGCFRRLPLGWYPCSSSAICRYATARCLTTRAQSQPLRVPPRCCASMGEAGLAVASSEQKWPLPRVRPMLQQEVHTQPHSRMHPMPRALALHPLEPTSS